MSQKTKKTLALGPAHPPGYARSPANRVGLRFLSTEFRLSHLIPIDRPALSLSPKVS